MQIYRVGGSVRDELLGLPVHDADWVVVGGSPQQMLDAGYQPVGKDFPVFLHPDTHEEYALARTERKTGPGYHGFAVNFSPDVTLEEDLLRRDLTINAMALDHTGKLIDPYDGQNDLAAKLFRHVSPAFSEDPVRILRVARFAARFEDFNVARETITLMRAMVANGEVDSLVAERVWHELARGLMSEAPFRMFEVLNDCAADTRLFGGSNLQPPFAAALDCAVQKDFSLASRYAVTCLALKSTAAMNPDKSLHNRLRVPVECREVADLSLRHEDTIQAAASTDASQLLNLVEQLDALRRPQRAAQVLNALDCWTTGRSQQAASRLRLAMTAAASVDAGAIARPLANQGATAIQAALRQARTLAIERQLAQSATPK